MRSPNNAIFVELRGIEPRRFAAKISSELVIIRIHVVTLDLRVLRICADVLRRATIDLGPTTHSTTVVTL